jgi:hypothetical protein
MHTEWLAAEHYRLHLMEQWPEGSMKEAGLTAARSALDSLTRSLPKGSSYVCPTCASRRHSIAAVPRAARAPRERDQNTLAA